MPPPAPTLPDEILEEIFLRLPPDEPASLASKLWLGLLSGPRFRSRYRELHRDPPMLGFLCRWSLYCGPKKNPVLPFVSTAKFSARFPQDKDYKYDEYDVWDCRHGRVLLGDKRLRKGMTLVVWDPMTGRWREMNTPQDFDTCGAAVLCNVAGCDHRACHDGPFRVVFVAMDSSVEGDSVANVCVSSSEWNSGFHLDEWGKACSGFHIEADAFIQARHHHVLVEDALHFMLVYGYDDDHVGILKYDLSSNCLSLIDAPLNKVYTCGATILMAMEGGSLGFAYVHRSTLYLWSRQPSSDGVASWTECKVINLKELLPLRNREQGITLIGSLEGSDIIFVNTDLGIYDINLKTLRWKKLWKREDFDTLIPYMSFYNPQEMVKPYEVTH